MRRNMSQWMRELIQSQERTALPIMTYPGLNIVNLNVMDIISDGHNQYLCIEALAKKYDTVAAVTTMDLSVEAELFGSRIRYSNDEVPTVVGKIIEDMDGAERLQVPQVGAGRTKTYLDAAKHAAKNIKDKPTFGGIIGPFSLAGRLMDMTEIMIAMMEEPEIVHTVLEKCTQFLVEYAKAFKQSGAHGIIIAEPAPGLLPPAKCHTFSSEYVRRIVDAVQDESFLVVLHNCGNTVKLVDTLLSTGAKAFHFGNAVDMKDIMPQIPSDRIAFGNIDPARVIRNGSIQDIKEKVTALLLAMEAYPNFVLSSGCDIPPGTTLENIDAFFQALDEYNRLNHEDLKSA